MKIVFCISGYASDKLRLQPWLTIEKIAQWLGRNSHEVFIITDHTDSTQIGACEIHAVGSLRGTNTGRILKLLEHIGPDAVVAPVTPLSLATTGWYRYFRKCRAYAYLSYPFYSGKQVIRALPHLILRECMEYGRQILIPKGLQANRLSNLFAGAVSQSPSTAEHVKNLTCNRIPVKYIPPGIDRSIWHPVDKSRISADKSSFLFVGGAYGIRGFHVSLDAMKKIENPDIRLRILARGADMCQLREIKSAIASRGIESRIDVQGGWLDVEQLRKEIQSAVALLLPFVLVPSELPVSVMESISCGTPVIVSCIDGLPDAAGEAGIVVPQAAAGDVAHAMNRLHADKNFRVKMNEACTRVSMSMRPWDQVGGMWEEFLAG